MKFTLEQLDVHHKRFIQATGSPQGLMTREEASKQLKEQDLAVYGDGKFPIEDYIGSICKSGQLMFSEYVQAVSMAMNDPIPSGIRDAFVSMDKDKNGALTPDELSNMLDSCDSVEQTKAEVNNLLACMDIDNDGKVSYAEILKAVYFSWTLLIWGGEWPH